MRVMLIFKAIYKLFKMKQHIEKIWGKIMNGTLLSYGATYIYLFGISKERRDAKKYLKK